MPNAKQFQYKLEIQLNNTPLVLDENYFTTKIVNALSMNQIRGQKFLLTISK